MYGFAVLVPSLHGDIAQRLIGGLMLAAAAVVAHAVIRMARTACPDIGRGAVAVATGALLLFRPGAVPQIAALAGGALAGGALAGSLLLRNVPRPAVPAVARRLVIHPSIPLGAFCALLAGLPLLAAVDPRGLFGLVDICYRAGALVFGGGHVVLPLLGNSVVSRGFLTNDAFLAGYGAAQALPGPLFAFAAYLGAAASAPHDNSVLWAAAALLALFLPGLLLAAAGAEIAARCSAAPRARAALAGIHSAVVGVLAAALWNPLCVTAIHSVGDAAIAVAGLIALWMSRVPPVAVVLLCVSAKLALAPHP
jgi:chromate transporter